MRLFDTHAHINEKRFANDQAEMLNQCFNSGVEYILCPAVDFETSKECIELAEKYQQVYASVGFHPHESKDAKDEHYAIFYDWAKNHEKIVAIGEIGLDYYYDFSDRETQKKVFVQQLDLARSLDMPIIIHDRDAHGDIMKTLKDEGKGVRGVFHCYSGSWEMAKEALKMNYYISFAGPVVFPKSVNLKEVAKQVPLDRILVETDSPYLTPPPFRGRRNNPAYVQYVVEEIANLRKLDAEYLAEVTLNNGKECFGIK